MRILVSTILAVLLLVFSACKREDIQNPEAEDNEKPLVLFQNPTDGATITGGNTLNLRLVITDNVGLSQYKVEIHSASDGHSHGKTQSSITYAWDTVVNVSGTMVNPAFSLDIPANVSAGPYHISVQAIDAAGYASDLVIQTMYLVNASDTVPPVITNLTSPDTTGGEIEIRFLSALADTTIQITCDLSDNIRLSGYRIQVVKETGTHKTTSVEHDVIYEISNTNLFATNLGLNLPITFRNVDFSADPSHHAYALLIVAIDQVNNRTELEIPFRIEVFP